MADHGGTREIPLEEGLHLQVYKKALAGQRLAVREVLKWIRKREAWLAEHEPKAACQWLVSREPDNADAALVLLGIAAPDPARVSFPAERTQLLLEPWAVQAALRRRRGLTEEELKHVRF
jgi:hypothetical protein